MGHSKNLRKNSALSPYNSIKGKQVLITGASSGIGSATARLFATHGARVGVHYRDSKDRAEKLVREIRKAGGIAELLQGDLLQKDARDTLIQTFVKKFGGIDVLVNNAGALFEYKHFIELNEDEWDKMFALHAKAPFMLAQKAFDHMIRQKWGRIINISSNAVKYGGPNIMHYYAAKAAMDACTLGFAREGAKYNVLVNSIRCGNIDTLMHTKFPGYSEKKMRERIKMIPLGRAGKPEEIAHLVVFLVSAGGNFATGQIISVAGGE